MPRADIESVFSPREDTVNERMYIRRDAYENDFIRVTRSGFHGLVLGETGIGKTWLVKHSLESHKESFHVISCGQLAGQGRSLAESIADVVADGGSPVPHEQEDSKTGGLTLGGKAEVSSLKRYRFDRGSRIWKNLRRAIDRARHRRLVLVIDNAEDAFATEPLADEVKQFIKFADSFDKKRTLKLIIVVASHDHEAAVTKIRKDETIASRVREIPPILPFTQVETKEFVDRAFNRYLKIDLSPQDLTYWSDHVNQTALGIPLYVQEYGELLAIALRERGWRPTDSIFFGVDRQFAGLGLASCRAEMQEIHERFRGAPFTMRTLMSCARIRGTKFAPQRVAEEYEAAFHKRAVPSQLNRALGRLSAEDGFPLRPALERGRYRWRNPKVLAACRQLLKNHAGEVRIDWDSF